VREGALRRRQNARIGKPNAALAEVTLAMPEQREAAVRRRQLRCGTQARDSGLLVVVRSAHPHHLGQPPHVVVGLSGGECGVEGRSGGVDPAAAC
jgi:hypothetical protein